MFQFFVSRKLADFVPDSSRYFNNTIKLASFAIVNECVFDRSQYGHHFVKVLANLLIFCEDFRLVLLQYCIFRDDGSNKDSYRWNHFFIPIDVAKGEIISVAFNRNGTQFLALTNHSFVYETSNLILSDTSVSFPTVFGNRLRTMDCNLDAVSCIAWWQNLVSSGSEFDDSIAFIGNRFGMILAIDVVSGVRLRHFYVPLSIERIEISADRSSEFLLINCHKSVQYKYPLGAMRNYQIDHSDRSLVENLQSKEKSIKTLFFNQLISNKSIENKEVNHLKCFSDSIYIEEDSGLLNTQETIEDSSIDGTKDSINDSWILSPQNHTGRIFVIKNNLQRFPNLHGNSRRNSEAEHIDSSRYSQNQIESNCYDTSLSPDSSKIEFDNPILEIYEFSLENFDIRFKAPPSTNKRYCFRINKELVEKIQSIRLIDCGSRFFLLLLNNEICFMISKSLTSKASSDESDLIVLNQEKSLSNISGLDGNLDEFINGFSLIDLSNDLTTNPKTREEFRSDSSTRSEENRIINAFVIKPGTQNVSIEEFLKQKMNTPMNSDAQDDPEFSNQSFSKDQIFFQSLLQTKYEESIQKIDEQILIVTDRSVFVIESMEKMFGNLFHTEIQKIWTKFYSAYQEDYDIANILPYVRLMVECFVSQEVQSSQRLRLFFEHSYQLWLFRSFLFVLDSIQLEYKQSIPIGCDCFGDFTAIDKSRDIHFEAKILDTLRLTQSSRFFMGYLIKALIYFELWSISLQIIENQLAIISLSAMQNEENRNLSSQILQSLIEINRKISDRKIDSKFKSDSERILYNYLYRFRNFYNAIQVLKSLVDCNLFEMAEYLAFLTGNHLHLVQYLLNRFSSCRMDRENLQDSKVMRMLSSKQITYSLILSTEFLDERRSINLIELYLKFWITNLTANYDLNTLFRLSKVLDPRRKTMKILLHHTLSYCNQTFLRHFDSFDSDCKFFDDTNTDFDRSESSDTFSYLIDTKLNSLLPIQREDLLNLYIFVRLLYLKCLAKNAKIKQFYDFSFTETFKDWVFSLKEYSRFSELHWRSDTFQNQSINRFETSEVPWRITSGSNFFILYDWEKFCIIEEKNNLQFGKDMIFPNNNGKYISESDGNFSTKSVTPVWNRVFSTVIGEPIDQISAGFQHIIILTKKSNLYAVGKSNFGQLGLGSHTLSTQYPALIPRLRNCHIKKIVCGSYHTVFLTKTGQMFSFGWALHGQLGHGSIEDVYVPKLIDYFERLQNCPLINIAAGYAHTAALDINGDLYIFGQNSYGQLGNICKTDTIKSILPRKVNLTGGPVKLISCGPFHTVVMIESEQSGNEKKIFCWGINPRIWRTRMRSINYFTIDSKKNSDKKQTISDYAKIRELSLPKINPNDQIIDIKAGQSYIIILTKSGKVFTMDYNSDHRAETSQDFDAEAMHTAEYFGSKIVDVSCGSHFVLALDSQGNLWNLGGTKSLLKAQNSADFRRFSANRERKQSISKSMFDHKRSCSDKVSLFSDGNHAKPTVIFSVSKPNQTKSLDNDVKKDSIHHYRCRQIKKNFKKKINQLKTENPVLKEQFDLLRTIIFDCYYSDFRSLIERFAHFHLYQLCSWTAWLMENFSESFRFQLNTLIREVVGPKEIIISESEKLFSIFISKASKISPENARSEMTNQIVKSFFAFWQTNLIEAETTSLNLNDLVTVVEKILHEAEYFKNPYFGIHFLCELQRANDRFRLRPTLNQRNLIDVLNSTITSILKNIDKMTVTLQEIFEKQLDWESFFNCSNSISNESCIPKYRFENEWKKLISTLMISNSDSIESVPEYRNDILIEINVPKDIESENENGEILVFNCGHYMSKNHYIDTLRNLIENHFLTANQMIFSNESSSLIAKIVQDQTSFEYFIRQWIEKCLKQLDCFFCYKQNTSEH